WAEAGAARTASTVSDAPQRTNLFIEPLLFGCLAAPPAAAIRAAGAAPAEGPDTRPPHRVFGTLCARAAPDRLDCSIGEAGEARRLKARVDLMDSDADGVLDLARHEVSILDGDRLQVLRFAVDHQPDTLDVIARWVEVVAIAGLD
ncbi:MAG: hypothetical protein AAFZ09_16895, partial [Pseudomonadota bacterium]